jgi:protein translocase SecG subunit
MEDVLIVTQVIFSVLLSLTVLSQNRSAGLSAVFGGTGEFHASKRGAEKVLSNVTLTLVVLFTLNSLAFLFI